MSGGYVENQREMVVQGRDAIEDVAGCGEMFMMVGCGYQCDPQGLKSTSVT